MVKRIKQIQAIIEKLLNEVVNPIRPVHVEDIVIKLNIEIRKEDLKDISGLIFREGNKVIIGVNKKDNERRQRFTIAHELGHFYLHSQNPLFIDTVFAVKRRDQVSSGAVSIEEIEANAFAAELLMPTKMLLEDLKQIPTVLDYESDAIDEIVKELADQYQVSKQAMRNRLINLGVFQEGF